MQQLKNNLLELEEIINALKEGIYEDLSSDLFTDMIIEPFERKYKKPFDYETGATKGVLIFKNLNFVIKIPFSYNYDGVFCGADSTGGWDYCAAEENKYNFAKKHNLEDCFAETKLLDNIKGYPIYIQEFATIYNNKNNENSNHTL